MNNLTEEQRELLAEVWVQLLESYNRTRINDIVTNTYIDKAMSLLQNFEISAEIDKVIGNE